MKIKLLTVAGCLMVCMICMVCPAVFAQDGYSRYEIFVGYSLMKIDEYNDLEEEHAYWPGSKKSNILERGVAASFTYNFTSIAGVETVLRYNSGYILSEKWKEYGDEYEAGLKKRDISLLVGPRLTFRAGSVAPFIHGLVGISHDNLSDAYDIKGRDYYGNQDSWSDSDTIRSHGSFGVALGGGLDVIVHENVAIRLIQADYYMTNHPAWMFDINSENKRYNNINLSFGIAFRFGR